MHLDVLLFAAASDLAGRDCLTVEMSDERPTAAQALAAVADRCPDLAGLLPACRLAIDGRFVSAETEIPRGSEVALIPPVSGG